MKKVFIIIIALFLVIVIVLSVILVMQNFKSLSNGNKSSVPTSKNLLYLTSKGKVKKVTISSQGVKPEIISIAAGEAVLFTNSTDKDISLNITGNVYAGVIIKKKSASYSPVFNGGIYTFQDMKNATIKGKILVSGPTPTSIPLQRVFTGSITPTIIKQSFVEVVVSDSGFSPSEMHAKIFSTVRFVNHTKKTIEIVGVGDLQITVAPIGEGKEASSPLTQKGTYAFTLKNDSSKKGRIIVE